jgi:regulator of replication initiation timing
MSKEIKSLRGQNTKMPTMVQNLGKYELLVEELATENSKLIIENSALKK